MNLSKSKYCKGIQCKKMLWLEKNKPEEKIEVDNEAILENGNFIHEVAKYLFGEHINIEFNENLKEMIDNTKATIDSYQDIVITEASFDYNHNFCSVDILKKIGNTYEMYEVKGSTEIKDIYINDISYQYYVLTKLGLKVKKCVLVHLNREYVRKGELDLDELFNKEDVTDIVLGLQDSVETNVDDINEYMEQKEEPNDDIGEFCFKPYECPFFKYCTKHLPLNNVFDIRGMWNSKKIDYYKRGIYSFDDLKRENLKDEYKKQIEYATKEEEYFDKENIRKFMNEFKEPLYFLDFETFQMPIPLFDDASPYEQIPFQYSLHILDKSLTHKEFLAEAGIDPRRTLAEELVKDIPLDVITVVYNERFEKGAIKRLANLYPDLKEHLMNIHDNIKDLMIPFKNQWYYSKSLKGSYSIKYVLPALFPSEESLDYHNLDLIHNGSEAMNSYATLNNKSKEEQAYIRERLLRYCELDTYAMVKIYEKLIETIEK